MEIGRTHSSILEHGYNLLTIMVVKMLFVLVTGTAESLSYFIMVPHLSTITIET